MSRPDHLLTAAEVAERLRTKPYVISRLCREGELRATKPMKGWLVSEEALEEFLAKHANTATKGAA